jgi:hypothetical protein
MAYNPASYFAPTYYAPPYFEGGAQAAGAISAAINGIAFITATLTAIGETAVLYLPFARRSGRI